MPPSSGISPASFFATAAALIQNKAALEMRNRAHLLQSSRSEQRDLRSTPDHLNLLNQGEYHHMPSKSKNSEACCSLIRTYKKRSLSCRIFRSVFQTINTKNQFDIFNTNERLNRKSHNTLKYWMWILRYTTSLNTEKLFLQWKRSWSSFEFK